MKLHNLPVLVVVDDAADRHALEEMIANWKMRPVVAESGPAAFEALERAHLDGSPFLLVILDAQLAGMDGYEVAARVKENPDWHVAAVIMLASEAGHESQKRARQLGAKALLAKPVRQSDLWDAIVQAIPIRGRQKVRPSAGRGNSGRAPRLLRILVAEDNPVNQELVLHLLERRGHSVIVAENGRQALAAIEKHKFDLVLMDVQMPEMGGIEATQAIRQKEESTGAHLPVVAMTAHAMSGDRERCLAAGMDGYLAKPLDPRTFLQTVESAVPAKGPKEPQQEVQQVGEQPAASAAGAPEESALLARFNGNRKLLQTLVKTFLEDCPNMMARIRKAVTARDAAALADAAHALKGSVGNFGPSAPFETARKMEISARQGTLGGSWEAFATLEDEMASFLPALSKHGRGKQATGRRSRPNHSPRRKR